MDPTYQLHQVFTNPRDDSLFTTMFDEYATLVEAKKAAKTEGLKRWVITQTKVVAQSND